MGLLDKAKAAAEQAATKAKEGAQELQTKRELAGEYSDLGKLAFDLVEKGELTHAELQPHVEKIRALRAEVDDEEPVVAAATTTPPASDQPPAMPT